MTNHSTAFQTLGIPPTTSRDEIKDAYRAFALKYHPDKGADLSNTASTEKMKALNLACEFLKQYRYNPPRSVNVGSDSERYDADDDRSLNSRRTDDVSTKQYAAFISEMAGMGLKVVPVTPDAVWALYRVYCRGMNGVVVYTKGTEIFHEDGTSLSRAELLWLSEMTKGEAAEMSRQRRDARKKERVGEPQRQRMDEQDKGQEPKQKVKKFGKDRSKTEKEMKKAREKEERVVKRVREKADHERRLMQYSQGMALQTAHREGRSKVESRDLARAAKVREKEIKMMREVKTYARQCLPQ